MDLESPVQVVGAKHSQLAGWVTGYATAMPHSTPDYVYNTQIYVRAMPFTSDAERHIFQHHALFYSVSHIVAHTVETVKRCQTFEPR